jgi:hypothetical protein
MASVGEKNRLRRARASARVAAPPAGRPPRPPRDKPYVRQFTGLEWMASKGALGGGQVRDGERYGRDYRLSLLEGGVSLKSSLDIDGVFGGGKGGGLPAGVDYSGEIIAAREQLALARAAVGFHDAMILALDLVCGRQQTPGEITKIQREREEIETSLRLALDLIGKHYRSLLDSKSD